MVDSDSSLGLERPAKNPPRGAKRAKTSPLPRMQQASHTLTVDANILNNIRATMCEVYDDPLPNSVHVEMDGQTVVPGDWIALPQSCRLGPGLYNEAQCDEQGREEDVRACMAGVLRKREAVSSSKTKSGAGEESASKKKLAWVDYSARRYVPMKGDHVLGVVTKTTGKSYRVDIGSAVSAVLPELAFEGATKRNKPNLQVGEVVYARVSRSHKDMEPELSCVDGTSGKACGMGQLPVEGNLIQCSTGLCRKLLSPSCAVREALGKYFKFELTVGLNGRVWLNSASVVHIIAISTAIVNSELKTAEQCREMVDTMVDTL